MNKTKANKLLKYYKKILGLQDWVIKLMINQKQEDVKIDDEPCCGTNEWILTSKASVIRIISKKEYGDRIIAFDFEKTLVHELIHLKVAMITENTNDVEILVDDIARAIVMAKRGQSKRDKNF
jgi:hypothetical protein